MQKVKQNPYCVILIDEVEKAHPDVLRLFLQVLDDGRMTSSSGDIIDFSHAIIFMTSNIGTAQSNIGFGNNDNHFRNKLKDFLGIEFVNRLDAIVSFDDIDEKAICKIIKKRLNDSGIKNISTEIVERIKKESEFNSYGVRKLDKIVNKYIEEMTIYNH